MTESETKVTTVIEDIVTDLSKALTKHAEAGQQIKREGNQIVIPDYMEPMDASHAIVAWVEEMEDDAEQVLEWTGHLSELLVAMENGMRGCFGQFLSQGARQMSFFGAFKLPSKQKTVWVGPNKSVSVPIGKVAVPGLPITMTSAYKERAGLDSLLRLHIVYKKKFEPIVGLMKDAIDRELRENSIFRGQAIDSRFNFIDMGQFDTSRVVYSRLTQSQLDAHLFGVVRNTKRLEALGMPVRRSVLLTGRFGTGKTLTALMAAKQCIDNGWTFLNVIPGDDIEMAVQFAVKYQPAMVFFEDIDQITPHGRTEDVNRILNTIDGFLSKRSKVVTVLTTNHTDRIERAMMRPGRIDAVVELGDIDEVVIAQMVTTYCPTIKGELEMDKLLEAAQGYTPSFISEACHRSMLYAIERGNENGGVVEVTSDDIDMSLRGLRPQFELMNQDVVEKVPALEAVFGKLINKAVGASSEEMTEEICGNIENVDDRAREIRDAVYGGNNDADSYHIEILEVVENTRKYIKDNV